LIRPLTLILVFTIITINVFAQAQWAHLDANNKMVYKKDANGNRIMDFSTAGYMGGGLAIPFVDVKVTLSPTSDDQTTAIQNAIDKVAAMPLVNGFRGAVLLESGTFTISNTINLNSSGVVLRGSGSGTSGTIINMTGSGRLAINMMGAGTYSTSAAVNLTDSYVPSGSTTFVVSDASAYSVGQTVLITKIVTQKWIAFVHMDALVRNGTPQTWIAPGKKIVTDRTIQSISGNTITLDACLTDSYDATYLGSLVATMSKYSFAGRIA